MGLQAAGSRLRPCVAELSVKRDDLVSHRAMDMLCILRYRLGRLSRWLPPLRPVLRWLIVRELREFNDALRSTPLGSRCWLSGGLLLGWAREGRVLDHDTGDVDLWVLAEDAHLVEEAADALRRAGFRRLWSYRNSRGDVTELTFTRHGAKFEFFLLFPGSLPGKRTYFLYDGDVELENEISDQALESFEFLDRVWLKPRLHEEHLRETYGRWEVPDPYWSSSNAPCVVARRPWIKP